MLTVITGPPCVGKSTYVAEHADTDDVVIDLDRMAAALTSPHVAEHDYADHVRELARYTRKTAIDGALELHHRGHTVWIIDTAPSSAGRRRWYANGARIVDLHAPADVLLERNQQRPAANRHRNLAALTGKQTPESDHTG